MHYIDSTIPFDILTDQNIIFSPSELNEDITLPIIDSDLDVRSFIIGNAITTYSGIINSLRPWQDFFHFPEDILNSIFLNENVWISIKISLKFVPKGPIDNIASLVQIMAWRRPGDKPLSESMMVGSPTHIFVTRPQWVKEKTLSIGNHQR